jgi:Spy/CpxP family protein refolding chaperone
MKNLIKIGSAVLFSVAISFSTFASQEDSTGVKKTPEQKATLLTMKMKRSLNLTEEQASKVKVINLNTIKSIDDFRTKTENDMMEQMKKVLTPEQFTTFQKKKAEKDAKHDNEMGHHGKGEKREKKLK